MNTDLLATLVLYALVMSVTPGPNNLMLMASGANFGILRTVPHMLGVSIGFVVLAIAVGMGLVQVFDRYPVSHTILKVASVVYLVYLAWKFGTAKGGIGEAANPADRPMTFLQACAFQWVNPKAWAMALTAITAYTADHSLAGVALVAVVFGIVNLPSVGLWALAGHAVRRILTEPWRMRLFNITMAVLILATLWPVLRGA